MLESKRQVVQSRRCCGKEFYSPDRRFSMFFEGCQAKVRTAGSRRCVDEKTEVVRPNTKNWKARRWGKPSLEVAKQMEDFYGGKILSSLGFSGMMTLQKGTVMSLWTPAWNRPEALADETASASRIGETQRSIATQSGASRLGHRVTLARVHLGAFGFPDQAEASHTSGEELHRVG